MRVNRHHGGEIHHFQFPNRFRRTEFFQQVDSFDAADAFGEDLGGECFVDLDEVEV